MPDEPTLGEVVRRLEDLARRLTELVAEIREDRKHYAETFVSRDLWQQARLADQAMSANLNQDIGELKKRDEDETKYRRQVLLWGSGIAITSLVSVALAIVGLR